MNFITAAILLALLPSTASFADDPAGHSLIRIHVTDAAELRRIWDAGLDFEGSSGKPGGWMEFVVTPADLRELASRGIPLVVTEPDLAAASTRELSPVPMDALGFGIGSMGGYYTLEEIGEQLDSMKLLYPGLITEKQEIGYSIEGRPIWGVKISDNPDIDESTEPAVLYTALTHAREPAGMMTVVYYMWWLLEQYATDPSAAYLVNARQSWFIPVINVDGYAYNESTNPSGGGMWRKNRRNNGNGTWGTDLNRNFGPDYMWDAPNGGSSTNTASDTYRGTNPFSEPESQTIDSFMRLHSIRACLNYHTYSRLLIYPFGYLEAESPDSLIYRELAFDMTRVNRYASGTDQQTVNYSTRGNTDDYMYGDTTKFRTYAMTPEVGTSFWPPSGQILPLALENLHANIHYSYIAGPTPVLSGHSITGQTADDGFLPGEPFSFDAAIRNKGLDTARALTVTFSTDSGVLEFASTSLLIDRIAPRSDTALGVAGTVGVSATPGSAVRLFVTIVDTGGYGRTDTVTIFIGSPSVLFADDAESWTGIWTTDGAWDISPIAHGGDYSYHDSPSGASPIWSTTAIQNATPVDLGGYSAARLDYWTKWAIEPCYDIGTVRISTNGGGSWIVLRPTLSNPASGSGVQSPGLFGYDAYTPGLDWVRQEIDISAFAGSPVLLRFELATDGADSRDGWYLDDIRITAFREMIPGAAIDITTATLSGGVVSFGEWPGATDGIDSSAGEAELAPPPPPGTFDSRWDIAGTNGSLTDIRDTIGFSSDTNVFTLRLAAVAPDYPVVIRWNRQQMPAGSWKMRDTIPGDGPLDADMWLTGEVIIADTSVKTVSIIHSMNADIPIGIGDNWGLVSLPVTPADGAIGALFPDALSDAYSFGGAYVQENFLSPGTGYWIRNEGAGVVAHSGVPFTRNVVANGGGSWILLGSVYCPILRAATCPSCTTSPVIYGYRNGYYIPDTLLPGEAYWYRGTNTLELDCGSAAAVRALSGVTGQVLPPNELVFTNAAGARASLRFGRSAGSGITTGGTALPPVPPGGSFDARFDTENLVEYFTEGADAARTGTGIGIRVTNGRGPTGIRFHGDRSAVERYTLVVTESSGRVSSHPLRNDFSIEAASGSAFRLLTDGIDGTPGTFRVYGNYPNPFNPRTSIRYDLSAPAIVSLRVRNIAGQEIGLSAPDAAMPAGSHVLEVDAGNLASGVYFYTLAAVSEDPRTSGRFTGKFIVVK